MRVDACAARTQHKGVIPDVGQELTPAVECRHVLALGDPGLVREPIPERASFLHKGLDRKVHVDKIAKNTRCLCNLPHD
jgi:hypothetical protein